MKATRSVVLIFAGLLVVSATCARDADGAPERPKPNIIRLGASWPSDGDVRDTYGGKWVVAGYERIIHEIEPGRSYLSAAVDWTQESRSESGTAWVGGEPVTASVTVKARAIPVTLNYKAYSGPCASDGGRTYAGLGVGAYLLRTEWSGSLVGPAGSLSISDSDSTTEFGANVFAGYEYGRNLVVEARYHFVGGWKMELFGLQFPSADPSGLMVTVGARF